MFLISFSQIGSDLSSASLIMRNGSFESKDSTSGDEDAEKYERMDNPAIMENPQKTTRCFSAVQHQRPKEKMGIRRKISVPISAFHFDNEITSSPTHNNGDNNSNRKLSRPNSLFSRTDSFERRDSGKKKLPSRKHSVPVPLPPYNPNCGIAAAYGNLAPPSPKTQQQPSNSPLKVSDHESEGVSDSPPEPFYHELEPEEPPTPPPQLQCITFYDIKIDAPTNARIKLSENQMTVFTEKVSCTLVYNSLQN